MPTKATAINIVDLKTGDVLFESEAGLVNNAGTVVYPKVRGSYRTVDASNYTDSFGFQWNAFRTTQIDAAQDKLSASKDRFFSTTGWDKQDLEGKAVLEVGSGAGRFSQVVLDFTKATLYSVDYSDAVTANFENNGHHGDRFKLFQGSIYELPFQPAQFDKVFCFGVLQHTPDVKASVKALASMVKPGGELIVDFYPRHWYTKLHAKYILRPLTRRMNHQKLLRIIDKNINWMIKASRFFNKIGLNKITSRIIPIVNIHNTYFDKMSPELLRETALLDTFDVYSPEHDQPQKLETVRRWFEEFGLVNIDARFHEHGGSTNLPIVRGFKK